MKACVAENPGLITNATIIGFPSRGSTVGPPVHLFGLATHVRRPAIRGAEIAS
jgi:hypothetical protein